MELLEAGLPDGVINLVTVDGLWLGMWSLTTPDFSGPYGQQGVFRHPATIGLDIAQYKTYHASSARRAKTSSSPALQPMWMRW